MATTEVETIGVRLTLDASGFAGGADKATSSMNAFTAAAERAVSGASQMKALGGAQVAGGGKSVAGGTSTQMAAVNVPLTVNAESLASLRAQIIKGLGSIPINITPTVSKAIAAEAKSVVSAVSTPAIGTRSGARTAVDTAVRNNLPTRAHGGAVQQGRPVLVGEERPEVYVPHSSGTIHPDAERFHREQVQVRKRESELAALEYQQQRQHERRMQQQRQLGSTQSPSSSRNSPTHAEIDEELQDRYRFAFRARGGNVRGYGGKYGSSRPATSQSYPEHLDQTRGDPNAGERGYIYHGTRSLSGIRRGGDDRGIGVDRGSWWSPADLVGNRFSGGAYGSGGGYGASPGLLRMREDDSGIIQKYPQSIVMGSRIPRSKLQYWGEDTDWHGFRKGRARARGGNVSPVNAARRARAWDITHAHGNIRGWENAHWRAQEAAEKAEDAMLVRYDAERTRWSPLFPSSNTHGWKSEPEPTISNTPVKGDPLSIWGDKRAHGGPAHRGGLPKGYHIEFYSPRNDDFDTRNFGGRLDRPGAGFKSVKKPTIMDPNYVAGLVAVVMKGDKVAATFPFSYNPAHEQWGVPTPYGAFHPDYSLTGTEHRRKGLATAAYMKVERFTGRPIAPSSVQLTRGKAFWSQPNRPFGKIFGPRPVDPRVLETAAREEAMDQSSLEFERRQAARARSTAPGPNIVPTTGLLCPTCGTAAGQYTSQTNLDAHMQVQHPGKSASSEYIASRQIIGIPARPVLAPTWGQTMPTRNPRRPRRDDPQEQMRRSIFAGEYGQVDPWAAPAHVPQRAPMFGSELDIARSHRRRGGLVHAGFGALAYRQTMNPKIEGGTFPLAGGPQPPKGYAVGIDTGTSHLVPAGAPRAFLRAFHEQRRAQQAAGNFPPYVGTWLHEGQIHIDPAAVLGRKREADMVARAKAQMAFFDLKRFDEVPTSSKKLRANAERIQQLIMSGRKRAGGGPVDPFEAAWKTVHARTMVAVDEARAARLAGLPIPEIPDDKTYIGARSFRTGKPYVDVQGPIRSMLERREKADFIRGPQEIMDLIPSGLLGRQKGGPVSRVFRVTDPLGLHMRPSSILAATAKKFPEADIRLRNLTTGVAPNERHGFENMNAQSMYGWAFLGAKPGHEVEMTGEGPQSELALHQLARLGSSPKLTAIEKRRMVRRFRAFKQPTIPEIMARNAMDSMTGFRRGGLVHAKQGAVAARMTPEEMDYVGNLRDAATRISPDQLKFGKVWYSDAQKWIKEQAGRYGIDPTTARGVTAALSAGASWGSNKSKAHKVFSTHGQGLFGESFPYNLNLDAHKKAKAIIEGANPEKVLGHTPKVGQFYRNLGGDLDAVTLDRWAYRTATRGHLSQYGKGPVRRDIDAAYRKVAGELGLHPVEFQAAAWLYGKGANPRSSKRGKPQSLGQLESMFGPTRAAGGPALGGLTPPLNQVASPGIASAIFQTAANWANDPFMAIMAWQQQAAAHKAGGGPVSHLFTVADQLGLHMRPSAHLARMAADYDAFITVENLTRGMPQKGTVNAKYMHHLLALGARQGDQLRLRATGTDAEAAVRAIGGLLESPGLTRIASTNRSLEKVDPMRMRAAEIFSKFTGRKNGGDSPKGLYIVGEIGKELFVPNRLTHLIPKKVMDQIPKAADGMQVIGQKPNSLFSPPEDGIIVPNRLMDQVPHAARGTRAEKMRAAAQEAMARADVWREQGPVPFLEADPSTASVRRDVLAQSRAKTRAAGPSFADALGGGGEHPGVIEIERAERKAAIAKEVVAARRGARTAFPVQRNSRDVEELLVQRAGAGKLMPSRTAQGAIASVSSFLFGGVQGITRAERERVEAATAYSKTVKTGSVLISKTRAEHEIYYNAFKKETDGVAKGSEEYTRAQEDYHASVRKLIPAVHEQNKAEVERFKTLEEKTAKSMPTTGGVLKNLGVIIGATSAYGMAMQAASMVLNDAAIPAVGKFVDQVIGFGSTTTRVTGDLAKATQAGNVTQSMAQAASAAGLGTAGLAAVQSLVPSVIAKAGAAAAGQAMDLRRAAYGAAAGNAPTGLYGGTGGILGSSLFAEQLGGNKGFLENIAGEAGGYRNQQADAMLAPSMKGTPSSREDAVARQTEASKGLHVATAALETEFSDYNEAAKRGSVALGQNTSSLKLMSKETLAATKGLVGWDKAKADLVEMANLIGGTAPDEITKLLNAGAVIVDQSGKAITNVKDLNTFLTQAAQGTAIASPEAWAKTNLRQIEAQLQMSQAQMERTANLIIPWQITEQLIGQPLTIPGAAAFPGAAAGAPSGTAAGMSPAAAGQAESWLASARDAQKQLTALAKSGYDEQLKNVEQFFGNTPGTGTISIPLPTTQFGPSSMAPGTPFPLTQPGLLDSNGRPPPAGAASTGPGTAAAPATVVDNFKALYQTAQTASQGIADTTNALSKIQLVASQTNWANSIRLATRGLGDALAMAGKTGEVAGTALGTWERTSHFLDVAGTKLSLMLSQRQINFQVAVAGFQAPGLTSEERGARQVQAKLEAGVAQKQLNIQTGQFDISQKVWIENANRAAFDASRAIGVMRVARDAEMATVAAQASIAENEKLLAVTTAQMDNIVNKANSDWGTITGAALTGISQFSGGLKEGVKAIYEALNYQVSYDRKGNLVISGTGLPQAISAPSSGGTQGQGFGGHTGFMGATGLLASASRPTDITFGEAGTETVAILRNPRAGSLGGGGVAAGPTTVSIYMTVQGDVKDEATVAKIVRAVEDSFNRKAARLGMRSLVSATG